MSANLKIKRFLLVAPIVLASFLWTLPQAAQAATAVILPSGADGVGSDDDLLAYACPDVLEVFAPAPLRSGLSMSQFELAQIGEFTWELQSNATDGSVDNEPDGDRLTGALVRDPGVAMIPPMAYLPNTAFTLGGTLQLSLKGSIFNGYSDTDSTLVAFTPSTFDFTVEVTKPVLDGSGTEADPYMITNAAELASMRCYSNAFFELANDITLSDKWLPISAHPGSEDYWSGYLDGAGHKITGLDAGHPSMRGAGLFGTVVDSAFSNLTIEMATVTGSEYVGVLFGRAESDNDYTTFDQVDITNVHIVNSTVNGTEQVGLMGGDFITDTDGLDDLFAYGDVTNSSASGTINITPMVFRVDGGDVEGRDNIYIGGMFGMAGQGANHLSNTVDVAINVIAEHDYIDKLDELNDEFSDADLSFFDNFIGVEDLGGYVGHSDLADFQNISVTLEANIEVFGDVRYVGGFSGNAGGTLSHLDISSDIRITSLGILDNPQNCSLDVCVEEIAGGFGSAWGATRVTSFVNVDSIILIEAGDGTNNQANVTYATPDIDVRWIGGHSGQVDRQYSSDFASRVKTNITIEDQSDASDIGGFIGRLEFDGNYGSISETVVSGSITIGGTAAADNIAGFVNKRNGHLVGFRNLAAVAITVPDGTSDVGPFGGRFDSASSSLLFESYWDSTVNGLSNPSGYPGTAATTAQLQDASFLAGAYFDLNNLWQLNGGYPELRTGLYGNKELAASGSPTVIPDPTPSPSPSPAPAPAPYIGPVNISVQPFAEPGGTAIAIGQRLNTVSGVSVNGEAVNYTVKTDGSLHFEVPKLANGKYRVLFSAASGGALASEIEVLAPQPETEPEPAPTPQSVGKVNVGSFNGKLVVYAQGLDGAKISWRIAGRWQVVTAQGDELNRFDRPVGQAGRNVKVEIFVDGERRLEKTVLTR